jgi:hypothetical protein
LHCDAKIIALYGKTNIADWLIVSVQSTPENYSNKRPELRTGGYKKSAPQEGWKQNPKNFCSSVWGMLNDRVIPRIWIN